jgi:hypothetical protein
MGVAQQAADTERVRGWPMEGISGRDRSVLIFQAVG